MTAVIFQLFLFFCISLWGFTCWSQQTSSNSASLQVQGLIIQADNLSRDTEKETLELDGNVQLVRANEHISCDRAKIFLRTKRAELYGRVKMISAQSTVGGDVITLDYESNTGVIYNGYVQSGSVIFEGKILQKIDDNEYFVTEADYTTCTNCPSSWSFSGQRIRAELGGYAFIKSSVLRFGSLPVLWLPYLIVPLKSDRQSGLLTPEFEQSSAGGFTYSQSFFWAISRSQDATISLKNYEKRGLKSLFNYRYVLTETSYGEFDTGLIRDRVFKNNEQLNNFRSSSDQNLDINRWFLKYSHYFDLPGGFVQRAQLNNASDLLYSSDFPLETGTYGDSAMENRISITQNKENYHWHIDTSYYINQLRSNPLGGNDDSVHRLPEISYSKPLTLIPGTQLGYSLDLNYVNFARSTKGYDDLMLPITYNGSPVRPILNTNSGSTDYQTVVNCENSPNCQPLSDGKYDPNQDLIRTGQRLDLQPSLYYPIQIYDGIDLFPKLTYRETHYQFNVGDDRTNIRRLVRTEITTRATMSRVYGDLRDPLSDRILHEFQPEIKYTRIPWIDHKTHPFFGFDAQTEAPISSNSSISDGDLGGSSGLQFDYNDRIYDTHLMTFAVTNRWVDKKWNSGIPIYRQIALLKVAQSYDIYQASKNDANRLPWSDISAQLNVNLDQFETYASLNYFPPQKVTNTSARLMMKNELGQFFQLGLTRRYTIVPNQDVDSRTRIEDYNVGAGFQSQYINLMGKLIYDGNWANSKNNRQLKSWAYISQFKPPGECWMITMIHDQSTAGETNLRLNFEFNFDGKPKPTLPPSTLDRFGF